ncbi:GAF domain-containing protein [Spirochaeta dissipatitropha]
MSTEHKTAGFDPFDLSAAGIVFRDSQEEIRSNLKLIIRIRWFVSPSILAIMMLAGFLGMTSRSDFSMDDIYINAVNMGIMLILNLLYLVLSRKVKDLRPLVLLQLFIDVVHFSFTIYKTGVITSPFSFLYFFVIFSGALLVSSRTAYLTATISSLLFAAMVILEHQGIIPHQAFFSPMSGIADNQAYVLLTIGFTIGSMYAFAALAGFLTGLIHKRQQELKDSVHMLRDKNSKMLLLYRTAEAMNQHTNIDEIAEYILDELMSFLNLDRALLYLNEANRELRLMMVRTRGGKTDNSVSLSIPLRLDAGLTARVALEQEAYNIKKPEESELINRELAKKIGLNPFAIAPLVLRGRTVGVLGIDRSQEAIDDEEFQILKAFANQAAIAMDSVRNQ